MSSTEDAIERLTVWLRDFGSKKSSYEFCNDLKIILQAARENERTKNEVTTCHS